MKKSILTFCTAFMLCGALNSCSNADEPLKPLADVFVEIAANNQEYFDAMQAVYKADRDKQEILLEKAKKLYEEKKQDNEKLAKKVAEIGAKLQDTEIECRSSNAMSLQISKAVFATVQVQDQTCNIVIMISCSEPVSKPYCLMMDKDDNLLWKTPARFVDGNIAINFRFSIENEKAVERCVNYGKLNHIIVVTEAEYNAGGAGAALSDTTTEAEPEPSYQGDVDSANLPSVQKGAGEIKVGGNLKAALQAATKVSYEYNADTGIWAHIGKVSIIIDEDQLNQKGVEFLSTIYSDIEPNLQFSPDYVKPEAKILTIEKD